MKKLLVNPALLFWMIHLVLLPPTFIFVHNSGYGYDPLEYLTIARSMLADYQLYDLYPSKGPALYAVIYMLMQLGIVFGHFSVAVLVTIMLTTLSAVGYLVARQFFDELTAAMAGGLVFLAGIFMEMNFLQPTQLMVLASVPAFLAVARNVDGISPRLDLLAGLFLALSFHFKSVALFYGAAIAAYVIFTTWRHPLLIVRRGALLFMGFIAGIAPVAAYFFLTGRGEEYWYWTILFPTIGYPSNTVFLSKVYGKLGWFHLLLIATTVLLLVDRLKPLRREPAIGLAVLMGLFSYIAVFKTQASHYFFPGAFYFCLVIAVVLRRQLTRITLRPILLMTLMGGFFVSLLAYVALYRPDALNRFVGLNDFAFEKVLKSTVNNYVPEGGKALFVTHARELYWFTGVNPAAPWEELHVQTMHVLEKDPEQLLGRLDDPAVYLVEFNPMKPGPVDMFFDHEKFTPLLEEFRHRLSMSFTRMAVPDEMANRGYVLWTRTDKQGK